VLASTDLDNRFRESGFLVLGSLVDGPALESLRLLADPLLRRSRGTRPGVRRVLVREPRLALVLRETPIPSLVEALCVAGVPKPCGAEAEPTHPAVVRSILFDKTPETNWLVPWHQDALIAVAKRYDLPGYAPWSSKEGQPHCRPPIAVLESIVTIRIHLDPCPADAGPLLGIAGSHRVGVLSERAIEDVARDGLAVEAVTDAGGVVIMSPLTVHRSPKATRAHGRRRVLHLDCSAAMLPPPLSWGERVALT
jgi:Phytanoyl-CoA dioxygenase (PhyH)